jgi:RNA polymerase sigma-70 factor (ECF subfamily)
VQPFVFRIVYSYRNPFTTTLKVINLHQEETEMIRLAIANNRQAQQAIYNQFSPKMLGVCRQYMKDMQLSEDVMITAFMKVFTNLSQFQFQGSFEGWIRRIMVNECISSIRVHKKIQFIEEENYFEDSVNTIEYQFSADDIQSLIDGLPEGYRMIFNLYAIEGFKHKEIAIMLGINEGTSKSQLSHARKILQQQVITLKKYEYGTK